MDGSYTTKQGKTFSGNPNVNKDEQNVVITCIIEAVLTHKEYKMAWQDLQNNSKWLAGWR